MSENEYTDFIDMRLHEPDVVPHDGHFSRLPPGVYSFQVEKAVIDQSKKGNTVLKLTFKVINEDSPVKGQTITQSYPVSDADFARRRMKNLVNALDIPIDPADGRFPVGAFKGAQMEAEVFNEEYDDMDNRGQPVKKTSTRLRGERSLGPSTAAAVPTGQQIQRKSAPANGKSATR